METRLVALCAVLSKQLVFPSNFQLDEEQLEGLAVPADNADGDEVVTISIVEGGEGDVTQQVGVFERSQHKKIIDFFRTIIKFFRLLEKYDYCACLHLHQNILRVLGTYLDVCQELIFLCSLEDCSTV